MADTAQSLKTKDYPIESLIFAEYNPRQLTKDQHKDLTDSIKRFGLVDPLIINTHKDRKNILIGGHQRCKIAKELKYKTVPCVEVSLTPEKERELNIRLNRNTGEWDYDSLANYFDVGELTEWGFTDDELQFYDDEPEQGLIDDDEIPEVEEAVTKSGDLWILGEHRLLCGDSTKKEDVEKLMDGQKADMVFTDPPFNISLEYKKYKDDKTPDEYKNMIEYVMNNLKEYTKLGKAVYVMSGETYLPTLQESFKKIFRYSQNLIWVKNTPNLSNYDYQYNHESIIYGWNSGTHKFYGSNYEKTAIVWDKDVGNLSVEHPAQRPIKLVVYYLKNSSVSEDIVIDLFLGSGSTLIACEKTNRKCYGMEIDPHYVDIIVKRYEDFTGNKAERIERAEC